MRLIAGAAAAVLLLGGCGTAPRMQAVAAARIDPPLRVLPLGDSITYGLGDPGLGSYRPALAEKLRAAGVGVDFVGSMQSGPAGGDRDNEGHNGWRIEQLTAHAAEWMAASRPDVVLLHIGTNDMRRNQGDAAVRLGSLLDELLAADPQVRIVVAQIVGAWNDDLQRRIDAYNERIPAIVAARGSRVRLVDQRSVDGDALADNLHPSTTGYRTMAENWFRVVHQAGFRAGESGLVYH